MEQYKQHRSTRGFTLIEVILSISLLAILSATTLVVYQSYQGRNDLDLTSTTFVQMMRRAQVLSKLGSKGTSWSVHVDDNKITLYQGEDFATRDQSHDEVYMLPKNVEIITTPTISGMCEDGANVTVTITPNT